MSERAWDASLSALAREAWRRAREGPIASRLWRRLRLVAARGAIAALVLALPVELAPFGLITYPLSYIVNNICLAVWIVAVVLLADRYARWSLREGHCDAPEMRVLPMDEETRLLELLMPFVAALFTAQLAALSCAAALHISSNVRGIIVGAAGEPSGWRVFFFVLRGVLDALSRAVCLTSLGVACCLRVWRVLGAGGAIDGWRRWFPLLPPLALYLIVAFLTTIPPGVANMAASAVLGSPGRFTHETIITVANAIWCLEPPLSALAMYYALRWIWRRDFTVASRTVLELDRVE